MPRQRPHQEWMSVSESLECSSIFALGFSQIRIATWLRSNYHSPVSFQLLKYSFVCLLSTSKLCSILEILEVSWSFIPVNIHHKQLCTISNELLQNSLINLLFALLFLSIQKCFYEDVWCWKVHRNHHGTRSTKWNRITCSVSFSAFVKLQIQ